MISNEMLSRYHLASMQELQELVGNEKQGETLFYQSFLIQTDYIPNKIIEAQVLGIPIDQDYTEILQARAEAREKLSELGVGT